MKIHPFHVIIVAAGSGLRMGFCGPKQHQKLNGLSPLERTLATFKSCRGLQSIVVVSDIDLSADALIVKGGKTRFNSVYNGLNSFSNLKNDEIILIHDAARPFVSRALIEKMVGGVADLRAVTLSIPVSDTLQNHNGEIVPRDQLRAIQTPQGFLYGDIFHAHQQARKNGIQASDDAQLVEAIGIKVTHIEGDRMNFKLTTPDDWLMAEKLTAAEYETRSASGYDVHAFDNIFNQTGVIRLGGIDIPYPYKLLGFSDADVVLHAVTDALYGTIGQADIGHHFPPGKEINKDRNSAEFLQHAAQLVQEQGGKIILIDITILCEEPKIGPYREEMRTRIAHLLALDLSRISIKATTTEGLGFTGRKEGVAVQAMATITLPNKRL